MKRAKKLHASPAPKPPAKLPPPRNPVARSPLLGKGAPHGKSAGARRRAAKMELAKLSRESASAE
jgi:hypothetical protein